MSELIIKSDEHFRKYENLIKAWASTYHRASLGDFDDMYQEASMVYLRSCDAYKPNMSKFSTFLYTSLRNNMFDMIRKK
jgi:RNA polymerase sigma factor (sigma-70 family)